MKFRPLAAILIAASLLAAGGCATSQTPAPVEDRMSGWTQMGPGLWQKVIADERVTAVEVKDGVFNFIFIKDCVRGDEKQASIIFHFDTALFRDCAGNLFTATPNSRLIGELTFELLILSLR